MSNSETERRAICYLTGVVRLDYAPPSEFSIAPIVTVDGQPAIVEHREGDVPYLWNYLAIVEKGAHEVSVVLGQVRANRRVEARGAQFTRMDFVFAESA